MPARAKAKGSKGLNLTFHTAQGKGLEYGYTATTNAVSSCNMRGTAAMKTKRRGTPWMFTGPICREYTEPQEGFDTNRREDGLETEHNDNEPPLEDLLDTVRGVGLFTEHNDTEPPLEGLGLDTVRGEGFGTEHNDDKEPSLKGLYNARGEGLDSSNNDKEPPLESLLGTAGGEGLHTENNDKMPPLESSLEDIVRGEGFGTERNDDEWTVVDDE